MKKYEEIGFDFIEKDAPDPGPLEVVGPGYNFGKITDKIANIPLLPAPKTPRQVIFTAAAAFCLMQLLLVGMGFLFFVGIGVWGVNIPVGWGFAIVNFVWWIGIGHAGTLISAILLLLKQDWRTSINRFAEAMTLFAVMQAGMYPILHLGRPWLAYWLFPYPNSMWLWPQPRSPLIWDVFAVSTYFTLSLVFWYTGLIPDLATMRDKAVKPWVRRIYGIFALGWRGSARHWSRYMMSYLLLGGLCTPLVVSVHTVVSFDFAISLLPGWHTTFFPPYFVAGAIYSGFAMVISLAIPARKWFHLEDIITARHLDCCAKLMLATGQIVAFAYVMETFMAYYSGDQYEHFMIMNRQFGPYAPYYWLLVTCNIILPQALWSNKVRLSIPLLFIESIIVNIGMWLERFVIVITALHRDFVPSSWRMYYPTQFDWAVFIGTFGFFVFLMCLFMRFVPAIPIAEMREVLHHLPEEKKLAPEHIR